MAKKVWNQAGALGAVNWAIQLSKNNEFTYGPKPATSRCGCWFCGTNGGKVRAFGHRYFTYGGKKFDIKKTYVCMIFVGACYAHGAGDPTMLKYCKKGGMPITANYNNFSGDRGKCWMLLAKGSAMNNVKLMPGDVIVDYNAKNQSPGHVCMYAGDNKIVEATSRYGAGSAKSIGVHSGAKNRIKSYSRSSNNYIMRYCGTGKGDGTTSLSLTGTKVLKCTLFFQALEKAAKQFYKKNVTYKSKCDSTAGHIRKTTNSSGFISQGIYNYMLSIEDKTSYPKDSTFSMGKEFDSCEVFDSNPTMYTTFKLGRSVNTAIKNGDIIPGDICGFSKDNKNYVMVYAGNSKKGEPLWYSYGAAGKKKNKGVKEWKNAEKPRKRGDYGNIETVVRINGLKDYYMKAADGSVGTSAAGTPSTVSITGFYEFYSGQTNSQVISFSPELTDMTTNGGEWLVSDANSIDEIRNEIISLGVGSNTYKDAEVLKNGQNRILGRSSSSMDSLSKKSASMWEKNFAKQFAATMEVMGDTNIKVGTYIYIDVYTKYGFRHHSSGIYYVEEAEDNISDGSFTTSLQLRKHGTYDQYQQSLASNEDNTGAGDGSGDGDFPEVGSAGVEGMIEWAEKIADNDKWIYKSNNAQCPLCSNQSKPQGWVCTTFCRGAINHGMFKESNKYWKSKDKAGAGGLVGGSGSGDFEGMLKGGGWKRVNDKEGKRGDILVKPNQHAMIYKGGGKIVHAAGSAKGILSANLGYSWSSLRIYRYGG